MKERKCDMNKNQVTRRQFIQTSSVGTTALLVGARQAVSANDKVRLGFIGVGGRGTQLLKYCTRIPDYEFVAICDKRSERVERAVNISKSENQNPKSYTDFEKMLEQEQLDGVIVATEVGNHAEVVIPVLEAGLNCFSEKPIEANVEKVDQVVKAARKAKGIFQVGFQRRYNPTFHKTIEAAQSDLLGNITFLQGHWYFSGGVGGWVINVDMSGGKLVEQACHHMDVMTWVMNAHPVTCQAMGLVTQPKSSLPDRVTHYAEDHSSLNFQFPDGTVLTYTHFSFMPHQFFTEKLWVMKDEGLIDLPQGLVYRRKSGQETEPERIAKATDYYEGTYEELAAFADHIRRQEKPLSNVETARIATLTALMGHQAMYNRDRKQYEPSQITWEDLGTTTDLS
jgi:predicted dehydrogenase